MWKTQVWSAVMVNTSESTSNSVILMQNRDRKEQDVYLGVVFIKADRVTTSSSLCVQLYRLPLAGPGCCSRVTSLQSHGAASMEAENRCHVGGTLGRVEGRGRRVLLEPTLLSQSLWEEAVWDCTE